MANRRVIYERANCAHRAGNVYRGANTSIDDFVAARFVSRNVSGSNNRVACINDVDDGLYRLDKPQ